MQKEIQGGQDDEESDQEQISSAQYIPHRGKSARPSVAPTSAQEEEKGVPLPLPADVTLRTPLTDTFEAGQGEAPANVEIALLSEDESQVLHGEIPISRKSSDQKDDEFQVPPPTPPSRPDVYSDTEYASDSYDSAVTEEDETTPTATPTAKSTFKDPSASSADRAATETQPPPIGAVELKPYNHQVGGHSTVYSFSRQAVCKQLNSKENEFYETVEQFHPELLDFLPRYVSSDILDSASPSVARTAIMLDETPPQIVTNNPLPDILVFSMSPTRNHPRKERPKLKKIHSPTHRKPPTLS